MTLSKTKTFYYLRKKKVLEMKKGSEKGSEMLFKLNE